MVLSPFYIILFIILLVLTLTIILTYLLLAKGNEISKRKRMDKLKVKIRQLLFEYLADGSTLQTRLIQEGITGYTVVEELLDEYSQIEKSDDVLDRIRELGEMFLRSYYLECLNHRRWSIRMNALYRIEDYQLFSFSKELWSYYQKGIEDHTEKFQVIRTLAKLQSEELKIILIHDVVEWPKYLYKEVINRYEQDLVKEIVHFKEKPTVTFYQSILEIISERRAIEFLPFVEEQLTHTELEVRIRALYSLGYIKEVDKIIPFSNSEHFQERMLFAKLAGYVRKERFKKLLIQLLSDPNWWVRNAAGEALILFDDGDVILQHVLFTTNDMFARDTAKQWIGDKTDD